MAERKYAAIGAFFSNKVVYPGGQTVGPYMGGAGLYALSGILWGTSNALQIGPAGTDFDRYFAGWFRQNHIPTHALWPIGEKNEMSVVTYTEDGRYTCSSAYGQEFRSMLMPMLKMPLDKVRPFLEGVTGFYSCGGWSREECRQLLDMKEKTGAAMMWEMPTHMESFPVEEVAFRVEASEVWSLNRSESFRLFGVDSEEKAIDAIEKLGKPCYYRVGKRGAWMIAGGERAFAPIVHSVPAQQEVDATGCGNSSTGAALWAWIEGFSPMQTCVWGNVAASFTVRQFGPYPLIDDEARHQAREVYAAALRAARTGGSNG